MLQSQHCTNGLAGLKQIAAMYLMMVKVAKNSDKQNKKAAEKEITNLYAKKSVWTELEDGLTIYTSKSSGGQ